MEQYAEIIGKCGCGNSCKVCVAVHLLRWPHRFEQNSWCVAFLAKLSKHM